MTPSTDRLNKMMIELLTQDTKSNTASVFDNKALPAWEHNEAFHATVDRYMPVCLALPRVQRFIKIGGTTGDFYDALESAFPRNAHPAFYFEFPNVSGPSIPMHSIVAYIRDSRLPQYPSTK